MQSRLRRWTLGLVAALCVGSPALAEDVVVKRSVTVRQSASKHSPAFTYPAIGTQLELLNEGHRTGNYYHVRLPDGRTGWVYYRYVERAGQPIAETAQPASMAVHYFDVDQGNAALVEFPCGDVLIDAGGRGAEASDRLIANLDAFFARRTDLHSTIDAVFITHTHVDHNSNLKRIAQRYKVNDYIHNGLTHGSGSANANWMLGYAPTANPAIKVEAVQDQQIDAAGNGGVSDAVIDPVACPAIDPKIRVLSGGFGSNPGWPNDAFANGNNHSLVIRIDFGRSSFLFTGDLELAGIDTLLARYTGTAMLDTDVWEVSHHGSYNGTTQPLLAAVTPQVAMISMGPWTAQAQWTAWAYGHPRRAAVSLLEANVSGTRSPRSVMVADSTKTFSSFTVTKAIYATGWDGDVTINADSIGRISVATSH